MLAMTTRNDIDMVIEAKIDWLLGIDVRMYSCMCIDGCVDMYLCIGHIAGENQDHAAYFERMIQSDDNTY